MMQLKLNCFDPFDPAKPHKLQQTMLSLDLSGKGIQYRHICAGRGSGKSAAIVLFLLHHGLANKIISLYLAPTYRAVSDIFMPLWREIVPPELYTYHGGDKKLTLLNGSEIWLRSRSVDNPSKDPLRGINCHLILDDEAAIKFSKKFVTTAAACLRKPGPFHAYITCSTPRLGEYADFIRSPGHQLHTFKTTDNPFLPEGFVDSNRAEMSQSEFLREFEAELVNLGGLIFSGFDVEKNVINYHYDRSLGYMIGMDIGSASASALLFQEVGNKWVVFAEHHGSRKDDNSAQTILSKIQQKYGTPMRVVGGNDLLARSSVDNATAMWAVRTVFGGGVPVSMPHEHQRNKEIQLDSVNAMLCNGVGERKLLISKNIDSIDPDRRGIIPTLTNFAWPEKSKSSEFLPKDHHYEHCADALMYTTVCVMNTPRFIQTNFLNQTY